MILIPEIPYNVDAVVEAIDRRTRAGKTFSIVVVAEGAMSKPQAKAVAKLVAAKERAEKKADKKETRQLELETHKLEREQRRLERQRERPKGLGLTILGALGIVFVGNTAMLTLAIPFDWWEIYEMGWPIELFLVSLGLCAIMYTTSSIWMLIPTGLVFGTGLLLTYSALSDDWDVWAVLWLCQVWVVIGAVRWRQKMRPTL